MKNHNKNFKFYLLISFIIHIILGSMMMGVFSTTKTNVSSHRKIMNVEFISLSNISDKTIIRSNINAKKLSSSNSKTNLPLKQNSSTNKVKAEKLNNQKTVNNVRNARNNKNNNKLIEHNLIQKKNKESNAHSRKVNNSQDQSVQNKNISRSMGGGNQNSPSINKKINLKPKKDSVSNSRNAKTSKESVNDNVASKDPFGDLDVLSYSDAIKLQIQMHWNHTVGAVGEISVQLVLNLAPDGSVTEIKEIARHCPRVNQDICDAFIQNTRRSILNAEPFQNLPKEAYHNWQNLTFEFAPEE